MSDIESFKSFRDPYRLLIPSLYDPSSADAPRRRGPGFLDSFIVEQEHVYVIPARAIVPRAKHPSDRFVSGLTVYIVEQWIVDRDRTMSTIVVYTGNETDKIAVDVLVPNPTMGPVAETLKMAQRGLRSDGARPKDTQIGVIYVTALPSFRSDLTIAQIPESVAKHREHIYANIALRRLGCGGRSGLSIQAPSPPQQEKFYNTFCLNQSGEIDVIRLVLNLVGLVHNALSLYGLGPLAPTLLSHGAIADEADGLRELISTSNCLLPNFSSLLEPSEGGVMPTSTLAALLTSIICVKARINALGSQHVPSDPFASRRRFLQVYRAFVNSLGFVDRALSIDALLAVKKDMADHPDGFLRSRFKSTMEEVSRLADISGDRKTIQEEEETGNLHIFVNGLRRAHWAVGVSSVHALWTGKLKGVGASLKMPSMRRARPANEPGAIDADLESSEAEVDGPGGTTRALMRGPTLLAKAGRAVGAGLTGAMTSSRTNIDFMRHSATDLNRKGEVLLGAPYLATAPYNSQNPSPYASTLALDEMAEQPRVQKNRFRSVFGGLNRPVQLPTSDINHEEVLLAATAHHGNFLQPPTRPPFMRRSVTNQSTPPKVSELDALRMPRRRRHSYSHPSELKRHTKIHSHRRLRLDVQLCVAYLDLRAYEQHLASLCTSLADIDKAYSEASTILDEPLRLRTQEIQDLQQRAEHADQRLDQAVHEAPQPDLVSRNDYVQRLFLSTVGDMARLQDGIETAISDDGTLMKRIKAVKRWHNTHFAPAQETQEGLNS